jgi:hypothetical protein
MKCEDEVEYLFILRTGKSFVGRNPLQTLTLGKETVVFAEYVACRTQRLSLNGGGKKLSTCLQTAQALSLVKRNSKVIVMIIQLSEDYWLLACTKILEESLALIFRVQREVSLGQCQAERRDSFRRNKQPFVLARLKV